MKEFHDTLAAKRGTKRQSITTMLKKAIGPLR
jgi:hypothetical protein